MTPPHPADTTAKRDRGRAALAERLAAVRIPVRLVNGKGGASGHFEHDVERWAEALLADGARFVVRR